MAVNPTAHSLACLRIGVFVTADAARLAPGVGGSPFTGRGFAPVGRQTKFHDITASSLPFDQPCLVAPCNNASRRTNAVSNRHIREPLLPAGSTGGRRSPRVRGIGRVPQGHVTSLDERSLVLPPVPDAIRCLVFRRHPRLHQEDRAPVGLEFVIRPAAGSWTMPRQWEIQRTWLNSARAAVRSPAKPNGV